MAVGKQDRSTINLEYGSTEIQYTWSNRVEYTWSTGVEYTWSTGVEYTWSTGVSMDGRGSPAPSLISRNRTVSGTGTGTPS